MIVYVFLLTGIRQVDTGCHGKESWWPTVYRYYAIA